ncbi:universal stress protein [Pontibacter beigongshangensis]|uniref:universal stress protein n=1 Tax=Pontibacter beigongshangensis TaxID=2574733 RepID=UPI00164FB20C|nr:universal stress protein [Pontibacter beigongshangensis]
MKKILVPTDFSPIAHHAFLYALDMAQQENAQVILLHVFHRPVLSPFPQDEQAVIRWLENKEQRKLEGYAKDTWQQYTKQQKQPVDMIAICRYGLTVPEILQACHDYEADLVVMGMRGGGVLSQAFLGSTTLQLIQENQVPVLAVPAGKHFTGLKSVVFALNLTRFPARKLLSPLQELLLAYKSKLHVLHVYKSNICEEERELAFEALSKVESYFQDLSYKLFFKEKEDVAEGIQQYILEEQADLLVLVPAQHSFMDRLLSKSITSKLASQAFAPLLALPGSPVPVAHQQTKVLAGVV